VNEKNMWEKKKKIGEKGRREYADVRDEDVDGG
jgi:hypothetical protein